MAFQSLFCYYGQGLPGPSGAPGEAGKSGEPVRLYSIQIICCTCTSLFSDKHVNNSVFYSTCDAAYMQNTFNGKLSAKITQNGLLNAKTLEKQMLLICFIKYCNVLFRLFL